jgi:hypothetical protein
MNDDYKLDGTWKKWPFKLAIKGNSYVSYYFYGPFSLRYGKGTFVYDNENFTLTSTHAALWLGTIWTPFWTPFVEELRGKYVLANDEVTVSDIEGRYKDSNGIWVSIKGEWKMKRCK